MSKNTTPEAKFFKNFKKLILSSAPEEERGNEAIQVSDLTLVQSKTNPHIMFTLFGDDFSIDKTGAISYLLRNDDGGITLSELEDVPTEAIRKYLKWRAAFLQKLGV